jgi:selenoprotein W-related protein
VAELINQFEAQIETISLIPSQGGRFEVVVNSETIYSKLSTGRHANPGEVSSLLKKYLERRG